MTIARDVWNKHPDELSEEQHDRLLEMAALKWLENEELDEKLNS